ncbi:MAG: hypothetical protein ACE5H9_01910 [Anaerolineae bacterium]
MTTHSLKLRFFDLEADIRSDCPAHLDRLAQMYGRFRDCGSSAPVRSSVEIAIWTKPGNPWGRPALVLDGRAWPLPNSLPPGYLQAIVFNTVAARLRSHYLIHAGAVSLDGQGIILAGDSGLGKTTLVLELVRRGFKFLSDESAALGRADRRLHPFPRSLGLTPGTLELAGREATMAGAPNGRAKWLLDIEAFQADSLGRAARIGQVIILRNPAAAPAGEANRPRQTFGLCLDRLDEAFLAAVRQLEGVAGVRPLAGQPFPQLRLQIAAESRYSVLSRLETLCRAQRIWLLDAITGPQQPVTFDRPARLETIPPSQAVWELLGRFQGGYNSVILQQELDGSSTRLFMELAAIIGRARCYQLSVGPLPQMADLVCSLFPRQERSHSK